MLQGRERTRAAQDLVATLLISGLVLAGLAAPAVVGVGLALQHAADYFDTLSTDLPPVRLAQSSVLLDSGGGTLAVLHGPEDRSVTTLEKVAPVMLQAIVAVEDARFYLHHGVDLHSLLRAVLHNGSGGAQQGASTLTEQYVKLSLLEAARTPAERAAVTSRTSYQRKLREARIALALERRESKQQILEGYLNIAYFGEGTYGIATAAQHYFGVAPARLTLPQAALLAGLVNSPALFDPHSHPVAAVDRRAVVLTRMREEHLITTGQWRQADRAPLGVRPPQRTVVVDACASSSAPFYCDWIRTQLRADPHLGVTQALRDRTLFTGGLTVRTTLDPAVQAAAQRAVDAVVPATDHATAIIVIVQPGTGQVLAMAANHRYGPGPAPTHTELGYLGYRPVFQGGSTFKVFTLLTALKQGLPLSTSFYAPQCLRPDPALWDVPTSTTGSCPGGYQNSDPAEAASYDALRGTWKSVNTYYVQLEERVGVDPVIATAESLGIRPAAFSGLSSRSLSVTLGAVEGVSPLEEASAYAALAAHGLACTPYGISGAADANGHPLALGPQHGCEQAVDPRLADTVTGVLRGVLEQAGATASGKGLPGRAAAGKTGTLNNESAAWFVGYTAQLAAAVVLGDPGAPSVPLGTVEGVRPVYGGGLPARIWQRAMTDASDHLPVVALPPAIVNAPAPPPGQPLPQPSVVPAAPPGGTPTATASPTAARPPPTPSPQPRPSPTSPSPRPAPTPSPRGTGPPG
jgi:membrane peptidoglycan carboxypeptidase